MPGYAVIALILEVCCLIYDLTLYGSQAGLIEQLPELKITSQEHRCGCHESLKVRNHSQIFYA
jgi:hypothetical protein